MPSVKETYNSAQRLASRRGYITTILKRRRRFTKSKDGDAENTHKALNACLQGGAADIMKAGMLACYKAGVFKDTGTPHLTVHDELDWSDPQTDASRKAFIEAKRILEQCVQLRVPLVAEMTSGKNWGECT